jgi:hypothetical protein
VKFICTWLAINYEQPGAAAGECSNALLFSPRYYGTTGVGEIAGWARDALPASEPKVLIDQYNRAGGR